MNSHKEHHDRCRSCRFAESIGQIAVFVTPDCPHGRLIRDRLAVTKRECEECRDGFMKVFGKNYIEDEDEQQG